MEIYSSDMNFVFEFDLSRNGMIKEILKEFDTIRFCFSLNEGATDEHRMLLDRIMVVSIRKLLCDKKSVLFKVCPDFKMPKLEGNEIIINESFLHMILTNIGMDSVDDWITADDWLQQRIAWFEKDITTFQNVFDEILFKQICDRIRSDKQCFIDCFTETSQLDSEGNIINVKRVKDDKHRPFIYSKLKEIGYYDLTLYSFLKHLSDKRGAHIDVGFSPLMDIMNKSIHKGLSAVAVFALHMCLAATKQIPELQNYWQDAYDIVGKCK